MAAFEDAVKARMMRGAAMGPLEEEQKDMARCKGTLPTGRRCQVYALPGEEFCRSCKKNGAEVHSSALPKGVPPEPKQCIFKGKGNCLHSTDQFCPDGCTNKESAKPLELGYDSEDEKAMLVGGPLSKFLQSVQGPVSPFAIVLDFTEEQRTRLDEAGVSATDLEQLSMMLLDGKLAQVVKVHDDPLAKSRMPAA